MKTARRIKHATALLTAMTCVGLLTLLVPSATADSGAPAQLARADLPLQVVTITAKRLSA